MELQLDRRQLCDLEMILDGSFYPLRGFMSESDYYSVLNNMTLADGSLFPLPICLAIPDEKVPDALKEKKLTLKDAEGFSIATLLIESIYKPKIDEECRLAYGTIDDNHPYVHIVKGFSNKTYVGGPVSIIQNPRHFDFLEYRKSPSEVKAIIERNKWSTVVGFQTRNIMHRSHYELSKLALEKTGDKNAVLLLNPTVGVTQDCDTNYQTRVRCYKAILPYYEPGTVLLSLLNLSMRMAGPREAVLHALIRQNYGCTHFIVGRDHAAPSTTTKEGKPFYGTTDAQKLLDTCRSKLKIQLLFFPNLVYVKEVDKYIPKDQVVEGHTELELSGTLLRNLIQQQKPIPIWVTFKEVINEIYLENKPRYQKGFAIYCIGLPCAGKSSLVKALKEKLQSDFPQKVVTILDADEIRQFLTKGLNFSKEDRSQNVRSIGYLASLVVRHSGIALVANIAPYDEDRKKNRELIEQYGGYFEVYLGTSLEECMKRDTKGLYKAAKEGKISNLTGFNDTFEIPTAYDIMLTGVEPTQEQIMTILEKIRSLEYIQ